MTIQIPRLEDAAKVGLQPARVMSRQRRALSRYKILDTAPEADFDNVALLAAKVCHAQSAGISFIDGHRQWFKACYGMNLRETPIAVSFCVHALQSPEIYEVRDALRDPCFSRNPLVTGGPQIRFYAGMRIMAEDGTPIATLCVFDAQTRPEGLTELQQTTLRLLAAQVRSLLELRRSNIERELQAATQAALSRELRHVAEHDVLTGLPHRGVFKACLREAIREADGNGTRVALMLVDVDHFKQINDSLGHDAGDAVLCRFANRLRSITRASDKVARLGGDEFGVLLAGIRREEEIDTIVASLNERLHEPMEHNGRLVDCRASIGVAIYPDHARTTEDLTKCSDLALAEAKRSRACAETFRPSMADEYERDEKMLSIAREGIGEQRIVAHYQLKVDLQTGALVGFEALARCDRKGSEPILPAMFALAFDDRNLAVAISRQMIDQVLDDIQGWVKRDLLFGHVAINTSAADFNSDDFAETLLDSIEARGLLPSMVELEVTEGVFLGRGAHHVARALAMLSDHGMRIALDDFGTGFASLSHLKRFPVDVLKIDKSFVGGIGRDPDDTAIVRALIGLGKSLGIETVAEGVETVEQAEFLKHHGCEIGQGFLFGSAQPADRVPAVMARLPFASWQGPPERPVMKAVKSS